MWELASMDSDTRTGIGPCHRKACCHRYLPVLHSNEQSKCASVGPVHRVAWQAFDPGESRHSQQPIRHPVASGIFHVDWSELGLNVRNDRRLEVRDVTAGGSNRLQSSNSTRLREGRSEEHTSELQSLMRISYAVFCLKKK